MHSSTPDALLQDYVTSSAEASPSVAALVLGDERLTYAEVERSSNRLARLLIDQGCEPGDRVGLCSEKSPAAVVAMVAVLKAGGAYVPIDVDSPALRVGRILESAQPRLVLASTGATELLDGLAAEAVLGEDVRVGSLTADPIDGARVRSGFGRADADGLSSEPPEGVPRDPDAPCHLLFTSGSTGAPKGVMITHRNVTAFVDWAVRYFGTAADDRISGHPPLHFDLSTFDIYGTFRAGAELHLVPPARSLNPRGLASFIRDTELTQWFSVPSVLTYMAKFDAVRPDDFPAMERLLWCGEVLPTPVLAHWMRRLPHVRFTNLYGPTEATIASSFHTVSEPPLDDTQPIPIGRACEGEELLVLDDERRPCPPGEVGDLYIAGTGLSPGYWRDPGKTAEAFVGDPRTGASGRVYRTGDLARLDGDGIVHFLGRADSQIKSRGYRIELGEIETALNAIGEIRECAVVGVESGGFEGTTICAAFAADAAEALDPPALRRRLGEALPTYMLPARWLTMEALPKNVNGKIDRRGIRELFEA